jgi:predicted TIM-barrel fold metal-dependent hydrolase
MAVIDVHAHLEERMLDVPTMVSKMDALGVDKVVLIPTMNDPIPGTPAALLTLVRVVMCSPFPAVARKMTERYYTPDGNLKLKGTVYNIYSDPDNETVAKAIEQHPDRFLGWIFLNPRSQKIAALDELDRWRTTDGFVGVKLHPYWHRYPVRDALPIARRCEELGLPILIHLGFAEYGDWRLLTDACPKLRLVFAHAGIPHYHRIWGAIHDNPNLMLDVSSPFLNERLIRRATKAVGAERVLYGTDAPYGFHEHDGSYDYGQIKTWVERLPVTAKETERMLGDNVLELLGPRV